VASASTTRDTGLRCDLPVRAARAPAEQSLFDDESEEPQPLELESSSVFSSESQPPELSSSPSLVSLLPQASPQASPQPSAAGAALAAAVAVCALPDEPPLGGGPEGTLGVVVGGFGEAALQVTA
jgi:hypothetical protein